MKLLLLLQSSVCICYEVFLLGHVSIADSLPLSSGDCIEGRGYGAGKCRRYLIMATWLSLALRIKPILWPAES